MFYWQFWNATEEDWKMLTREKKKNLQGFLKAGKKDKG